MTVVQPAVDCATPKRAVVPTNLGDVEVHELQLGGLLDVIAEFDSLTVDSIPSFSVLEVLSDEQRAEFDKTPVDNRAEFLQAAHQALTDEQRRQLNELGRKFFSDLTRLLSSSKYLFLQAIRAFTDLPLEQAEKLSAVDALKVLTAALDTIDMEATVSAVLGFSKRIGGLMAAVAQQSSKAAESSNGKRKSSRGTRGASS